MKPDIIDETKRAHRRLPDRLPPLLAAFEKFSAFGLRTEQQLQDALEKIMPGQHIDKDVDPGIRCRISTGGECYQWEREKAFTPKDRIDFVVYHASLMGTISYGIECKVKSGGMDTFRQLERYARHVDVLILISTVPVRIQLPLIMVPNKPPVPLIIFELWKNLA